MSVWCVRFASNFGDIMIPNDIEVPKGKVSIYLTYSLHSLTLYPFCSCLSFFIEIWFNFKVLDEFQTFNGNKLNIDGRITILDSESFYLPNVQMNIVENGYNFWVGNYSGVSRSGKVVPSGKMTKVRSLTFSWYRFLIINIQFSAGLRLKIFDRKILVVNCWWFYDVIPEMNGKCPCFKIVSTLTLFSK